MDCWDRCGETGYVRVFSRYEIAVLNSYTCGLLNLIERRVRSYEPVVAGAGHEVRLPTEVSQDPRIMAILRAELGWDEPDWVLALGEERCLSDVKKSLHLMASTLPISDGVIHLRTAAEAAAWSRSVRLFVTSIATVADDEGRVNDKDVGPTVAWLIELSCALRTAHEKRPV